MIGDVANGSPGVPHLIGYFLTGVLIESGAFAKPKGRSPACQHDTGEHQ